MRSFLSSGFGRGGRGGDEGLRERAGDMSQKRGGNAAKMKFTSGAVTTDYRVFVRRAPVVCPPCVHSANDQRQMLEPTND